MMGLDKIIGSSASMRCLRRDIERFAESDLAVLIQGPSGSGKELVAGALHALSGRTGSFIPTNVCAVPESMFEPAYFGHVRGAFTNAFNKSEGFLAEANEGSILLDEITGLAMSLQPKLLRALDTRSFRPVGADRDRYSDFRVISATNESIQELVARRRFREDLMYRLTSIIAVPALADHIEDVAELAEHFARSRSGGEIDITRSALRYLHGYSWPGNVRQLASVVYSAIQLTDGKAISKRDVQEAITRMNGTASGHRTGSADHALINDLEASEWDTVVVAEKHGVDRSTIYRRMAQAGVQPRRRRWRSNVDSRE